MKTIQMYILGAFTLLCTLPNTPLLSQESNNKSVVLVHGAFADRSGWGPVYKILKRKGFQVDIVQIPLTSLTDDITAVEHALDRTTGNTVLVGHSWSGTVITEAGAKKNVKALVYVDAFVPDVGETTLQWVESAPAVPESGLLPPDDNGLVYFDKEKFHAGFAADLSKSRTTLMADSQQPIAAHSFLEKVTVAAWHSKPSFGIIGTADKSINPEILRNMYRRAGLKTEEIKGASHAVFLSHPRKVAKMIIEASK